MTIEERAINAFPCEPCSMAQALKELPNLDCSYCNRLERIDDYIKGATEQKQIDDKEMSDALFIQHQMLVEKAIDWVRYYNNNGGCLFDGWENNLIKAM